MERAPRRALKGPGYAYEAGCGKRTGKVSLGGLNVESTGWFHPAVPINGMVKSEASDGSVTTELLDYGTTGAHSVLE